MAPPNSISTAGVPADPGAAKNAGAVVQQVVSSIGLDTPTSIARREDRQEQTLKTSSPDGMRPPHLQDGRGAPSGPDTWKASPGTPLNGGTTTPLILAPGTTPPLKSWNYLVLSGASRFHRCTRSYAVCKSYTRFVGRARAHTA